MNAYKSYIICTSPRSGSTLLCKLLQETGIAGFPDSHFHAPSLVKWLDLYNLKREDFSTEQDALKSVFGAIIENGTGTSDVFGLRLQRHSFDYFVSQLAVLFPSHPSHKSRLHAAFGNTLFIHLTRENKLDQAISYVRAKQSGLWHLASNGTEMERLSEPREVVYDQAAIASQLAVTRQMEDEWESWFVTERIKPLRVTYEDLSAAPYAILARILGVLDLTYSPSVDAIPPVAKLADTINVEWAERFRSETTS